MNIDFNLFKNDDLVRAEINGNAILMNKTANRRLLSAPRTMIARVKQHSARSIVLSYNAKRPLTPPVDGLTLSEITIATEDMPYVKKLELAVKPKSYKEITGNASTFVTATEKELSEADANPIAPIDAEMHGVEVIPAVKPGLVKRISMWLTKLLK